MLKKGILSFVLFGTVFCQANNNIKIQEVEFPTGVTKLSQEVMEQASDIYNQLPEKNFAKIRIKGKGEENWSRFDIIQLAKKRSRAIIDFFAGIGCKEKNIKVDYNGVPKVILFKPKATYSVSGKIDLSSIEQQCFTINPTKSEFFTTENGNVFVFDPSTFVDGNGVAIKSPVDVCLWEFVKKKDIVKGALSSGDEHQVLESASSFYIQCNSAGKEVGVQNNTSFKIYLKRPQDANGYQTYYGKVDNGNLKWQKDLRSRAYTSMFDEGLIHEQNMLQQGVTKMKVSKSSETESGSSNESEYEERLFLKSDRVGWVNCDRIVNVRRPCDLKLTLEGEIDEFNVRLVFEKRNVVVPGLASSNFTNEYKFSRVPSGEAGYVLAYKKTNGGYQVAYSQVTLGYIQSINLKTVFKTEEEFNSLLDSLLN